MMPESMGSYEMERLAQAWKQIQESERGHLAVVRRWHPKCETCGHWKDAECPYFDWADAPADHYCADHTDFDKPTENDNDT